MNSFSGFAFASAHFCEMHALDFTHSHGVLNTNHTECEFAPVQNTPAQKGILYPSLLVGRGGRTDRTEDRVICARRRAGRSSRRSRRLRGGRGGRSRGVEHIFDDEISRKVGSPVYLQSKPPCLTCGVWVRVLDLT